MKLSRIYLVLVVVLTTCVLLVRVEANVAHKRHHHQANEIPGVEAELEREHKLLIECKNEDYRAYIKCLKREKRQHTAGPKQNCLSECFDSNCSTPSCIDDCRKRCHTRLTFTKTLETTYDCDNESCKSKSNSIVPTNITTNIHIQNIMPNATKDCATTDKSTGSSAKTITDRNSHNSTTSRIEIHNIINNNLGEQNPNCPCPQSGCNCYNQYNPWRALPQITIGFGGGGSIEGCMFPSWPCWQRYPTQQQPTDCSICLMFQIRCNPACFNNATAPQGAYGQTQSTTTRKPNSVGYPSST